MIYGVINVTTNRNVTVFVCTVSKDNLLNDVLTSRQIINSPPPLLLLPRDAERGIATLILSLIRGGVCMYSKYSLNTL